MRTKVGLGTLLLGVFQLACGGAADGVSAADLGERAHPDFAATLDGASLALDGSDVSVGDLAGMDLAAAPSDAAHAGGAGDGGALGSGLFDDGVVITLTPSTAGASLASFGVPLARGWVSDVGSVEVRIAGAPIAASVSELLPDLDLRGHRVGVRALRVQLAAALVGKGVDVEVRWQGGSTTPATSPTPFSDSGVSFDSPFVVTTTTRTIAKTGSTYALADVASVAKTVFTGREPRILATYPDGYLAATGILGPVRPASVVRNDPTLAGLRFLSESLESFLRSAMYDEPYGINPDPESLPDFATTYEAWLYDRCATFLVGYTHLDDVKLLRHALQTCSSYEAHIALSGANRGYFTGKPEPDLKYSHARGLYAYYAMTGDETAAAALTAIADLWLSDPLFVAPYRAGHTRGIDKLWTERLLGVSLEGLLYGHRLANDQRYLDAFLDLLATAHLHITGDAAALATINPGVNFPPQNCFIQTGEQHADGTAQDPWCSSWMSELVLDALAQYAEHTSDPRVGEIAVRLGRFLRDVGTGYFWKDPLNDSFLQPSRCWTDGADDPRMLTPFYGSGLDATGTRIQNGEWDDFEHCSDASAIAALARWALAQGTPAAPAPAPFATEAASLDALHKELLYCAAQTFRADSRPHRNPATWTSADLAAGAANPSEFIKNNKIGFPQHHLMPLRKVSWWFNTAMLQFGWLSSAGLPMTAATGGVIQPAGCP